MKLLNLNKISIVYVALIALIVLITIRVIVGTISFTKEIIRPTKKFEHLSFGKIDIPVMRPYEDVFFYIKPDKLKNDPSLEQKLQRNEYIFHRINGLVAAPVFILLLIQLLKLIGSIKNRDFYNRKNAANVKNIAYLICLTVFIDFLAYQSIQFVVPLDLILSRINYLTLKDGFFSSLAYSIDLTQLIIAFVFYSISIVFSDALELKEQTELTI
jgi:hypothetical protein